MRKIHDLSTCAWTVSGYAPYEWRLRASMETGIATSTEVTAVPAPVPGSVQEALRAAGQLPDWNVGLNATACEWVENRHWVYEVAIPDAWLPPGARVRLVCLGLDYCGLISLNGAELQRFSGSHVPVEVDLGGRLQPAGNLLQIVFTAPPRWLGQFGYTSQMTEWKPRFYYTWDWVPRLVQTGIWDQVLLEVGDGAALGDLRCLSDFDPASGTGYLKVWGDVTASDAARVAIRLTDGAREIAVRTVPAAQFRAGLVLDGLPVQPWWPNGAGTQPLYRVACTLLEGGIPVDQAERRVGFKHVEWRACEGAPAGADPWLCVVNGRPLFLQGVNWTPIRPFFADVPEAEYRKRVDLYRELGCNVFRVWGGSFLEKELFYDLCDAAGILVWQEFPLSSSGWENWPPEDEASINALCAIARSYIRRRQHHASLLLWCGGNELQGSVDGGKTGCGKPVPKDHPLMLRWARLVADEDPGRRFLESSSSGPRFCAAEKEFGQGLHWDIHGPWKMERTVAEWREYWEKEDALFRSETGSPGASPVDVIEAARGEHPALPATLANPLWRRNKWWIEWPRFVEETGRDGAGLAEYVAWSQARQATALSTALRIYKGKFPRCGGMIFWMGHDCFPCPANTSILDYHGRPKPAALAIGELWRTAPEALCAQAPNSPPTAGGA